MKDEDSRSTQVALKLNRLTKENKITWVYGHSTQIDNKKYIHIENVFDAYVMGRSFKLFRAIPASEMTSGFSVQAFPDKGYVEILAICDMTNPQIMYEIPASEEALKDLYNTVTFHMSGTKQFLDDFLNNNGL